MIDKKILIYGANGFTGKLFARHLLAQGYKPILAGRNKEVEQLGQVFGCPARVFSVEDARAHLDDIDAVVNLASPFSITQQPIIEACLNTGTHYFDVSSEYVDMVKVNQYHSKAEKAGVVLLPAAGIFSVPMDIVARLAANQLDNPTHLRIGATSTGKPSRGSFTTALGKIEQPGHKLVNGQYEQALPGHKQEAFTIFGETLPMVYHPWRADLFTVKLSTQVENIETYAYFPDFAVKMMKGKLRWLRSMMLNWLVKLFPKELSTEQLDEGEILVKVIATGEGGEKSLAEFKGPNGYRFTVEALTKLLELTFGTSGISGFVTPSQFGTEWVLNIDDVAIKVEDQSVTPSSGNESVVG